MTERQEGRWKAVAAPCRTWNGKLRPAISKLVTRIRKKKSHRCPPWWVQGVLWTRHRNFSKKWKGRNLDLIKRKNGTSRRGAGGEGQYSEQSDRIPRLQMTQKNTKKKTRVRTEVKLEGEGARGDLDVKHRNEIDIKKKTEEG